MSDIFTPEKRSDIMSRIRSTGTGPELKVAAVLDALGYEYELNAKDVLGKPDFLFREACRAIFVHGCFWHDHECRKGKKPRSNMEYWLPKLERNKAKDAEVAEGFADAGWPVLVVWECELLVRNREALVERIDAFLQGRMD